MLKEIEWSCTCRWAEYHDECKHILAATMIMLRDKLRTEIKLMSDEQ